jgi:hypothetical protein
MNVSFSSNNDSENIIIDSIKKEYKLFLEQSDNFFRNHFSLGNFSDIIKSLLYWHLKATQIKLLYYHVCSYRTPILSPEKLRMLNNIYKMIKKTSHDLEVKISSKNI